MAFFPFGMLLRGNDFGKLTSMNVGDQGYGTTAENFYKLLKPDKTCQKHMIYCRISPKLVICVVMPKFGSEPRFEPEPLGLKPKFGSRFRAFAEPDPRPSSRFS